MVLNPFLFSKFFCLTFFRFFCRIKVYKGKWRIWIAVGCCGALLCGCHSPAVPAPNPIYDVTMRGVWLSYIELDAMLGGDNPAAAIAAAMERCANNGLNTVFFHVRAHGDAYFPSAAWPMAESVPAGFDKDGMPIGLQILAPQLAECDLFNFGYKMVPNYFFI